MPSIAIQSAKAVVSAADALGNLTVDSTAYLYPGANAWVTKDDGSVHYRVKILAISGTTSVKVRRYPQSKDPVTNVAFDDDKKFQGNYGYSDMSAVNGASHIYQEAQSVPVDPAYSKRVLP